ncbi:MAG: Gfo/Idh/MocA family oxidoreductase [Planctomycetaceae bacterium]|jgi:predicted dehydrogenase|nr:Gfo/Idh/MocA family oxidoreductase [Planctomycetaceae bacterium]
MTARTRSTRRRFLQVSAASAGAAAAPYVITSKALGDATTPPASDRIVMGGIGIGNMGGGDMGAFLGRNDVQYVAVCDVRQKWREGAKGKVDAKYGNADCAAFVDFRDLLARADIDAVHIATPDHWHAIMTIWACRAGKDVYLQKPETLTLREGPLMVAAARRYGRVVSGGSQRVLGDYRGIVDPCWAGEIGGIKSVDINVGGPSMPCYLPAMPTPSDIDWELWLGPAPWEPYNPGRCDGNFGTGGNSWRSYVDYSGGSLTDWGAHHFGGAIFAADLRELQPAKVAYHPASADGKDPAYVSLTYPNKVEVHHNRPQHLRPAEGPRVSHQGSILIIGDGQKREPKPVPLYRDGESSIYGDFIASVKTRERPFRDIELAANTMTGPHMVAIAYRLQRSLTWDRAAQQFTGDEEANRLLDRARREPWLL